MRLSRWSGWGLQQEGCQGAAEEGVGADVEEGEDQSSNKTPDSGARPAGPAVLEGVAKSNLLSPHTAAHWAYRAEPIAHPHQCPARC
jgi:hypothetical protein